MYCRPHRRLSKSEMFFKPRLQVPQKRSQLSTHSMVTDAHFCTNKSRIWGMQDIGITRAGWYVLVHSATTDCTKPAVQTACSSSDKLAIPVEIIRGFPVAAAFSIKVNDYFQSSQFCNRGIKFLQKVSQFHQRRAKTYKATLTRPFHNWLMPLPRGVSLLIKLW